MLKQYFKETKKNMVFVCRHAGSMHLQLLENTERWRHIVLIGCVKREKCARKRFQPIGNRESP
jgi:hypothetical protein